jgi:hypothetical protein
MRRLLAAIAVLTLTACITDSVGIVGTTVTGGGDPPSTTGIAGTYTLKTVGGANLPFTMSQSGADKVELIDDTFTLTNANTWSEAWHERRTVSGVATVVARNDAGTFTRSSTGEMVFISPTSPTFTGTLSGTIMTLYAESITGGLLPAMFTK